MIDKITYKTQLEELLDLNQIVEIIGKFTKKFEECYTSNNENNQNVKRDITVINNRIVEIAKEQRRKELEKLLEKTSERISTIDEQLYTINNEIMFIRNKDNILDKEQKEYELDQLLNIFLTSKAKFETKRKKIFEYLSLL